MKKLIILIGTILLIGLFSYFFIPAKKEVISTITETKLDKMSLDQKIGQLFIIGIEGKAMNAGMESLIREVHPGGILLLQRNIENEEQLKELIISLQKVALEDAGLPLFIAIDQEGGLVSRIDWIEKTPQADIQDKKQAYQIGLKRGQELKDLGINLNLAPLLDESLSGDFLFTRSFQKNPEVIGRLAKSIIDGQKEAGILTAIKHFPGYSNISFNPEEKLATVEKIPEITQFKQAAESNPEFIMTSNVVYKEGLPFTFPEIDFLRNNIPGDYLVISDDLSQNSLLDKFSLEDIVSLPIKAGVDVLIFSGWRISVREGISAFKKAIVPISRINESVLKIIELKNELL